MWKYQSAVICTKIFGFNALAIFFLIYHSVACWLLFLVLRLYFEFLHEKISVLFLC